MDHAGPPTPFRFAGGKNGLLLGSCSEAAVLPDACLKTGGAFKALMGPTDDNGPSTVAVAFWAPVEKAGFGKRSVISLQQDSDALEVAAKRCYGEQQAQLEQRTTPALTSPSWQSALCRVTQSEWTTSTAYHMKLSRLLPWFPSISTLGIS